MSTEITSRGFEITPEIRQLIETKLAKIQEKLFDDVIDVRVVLDVQKYRNICEIIIVGKEHDVKSVQDSDHSMQDAINAALDHIKRQAQKNREKIRDHHRSKVTDWTVNVLEPGNLRVPLSKSGNGGSSEPGAHRIIRSTNLAIRPMSIEEAALRLDDSKNEFIVFRDVDNDRVSVIYKRRDNHLGLISPEF
jgi:putative sigma-54 modulation protein